MDSECEAKLKGMQKYVPFLGNLIETLREDSSKAAKLSQMQLLFKLLTKPDVGVTIDTLTKCEEVLEKVFGNSQQPDNMRSSLDENFVSDANNSDCAIVANVQIEPESDDAKGLSNTVSSSNEISKGNTEESPEDRTIDQPEKNANSSETKDDVSMECPPDAGSETHEKPTRGESPAVEISMETASPESSKNDQEEHFEETMEPENSSNTVNEEPIEDRADDEEVNKADVDSVDGKDTKTQDISSEAKSECKDEEEGNNMEKSNEKVNSDSGKTDNDISDEKGDNDRSENNDSIEATVRDSSKEEEIKVPCEDVDQKAILSSEDVNKVGKEELSQEDKNESKDESSESSPEEQIKLQENSEANCIDEELTVNSKDKLSKESGLNNSSKEKSSQAKSEDDNVDDANKTAEVSHDDGTAKEILLTEELEKGTKDDTKGVLPTEELENDTIKDTKEKQETLEEVEEKKSGKSDDDDLLVEMKSSPANSSSQFPEEEIQNTIKLGSEEAKKQSSKLLQAAAKDDSTIRAIQLKPKNPSEKPAVVYLVKKGAQKPMETIDLLDSDSEDDDVILVSEVGLKKKPTVPKPIVQKRVVSTKFPQPKVLGASPSHNNKPMFAITSVQSINQQRSLSAVATPKGQGKIVVTPTKTPQQSKAQPLTPMQRTSIMAQPMIQKTTPVMKAANSPLQRMNSQEKNKLVTPSSKSVSGRLSRDSTLDDSTSDADSSKSTLSQCIDDPRAIEWVQNFVNNALSPAQNVTPFGMELLQKVLDFQMFCKMKSIIEENKKLFSNVEVYDANLSEGSSKHEEIKNMFIRNGCLTEIGSKLATLAKQSSNKVYTTDRRSGTSTSRSRNKRPKELEDDEYAPTVCVEFAQETVADRRKSLRRESKTNRKQYFAYEDDDDSEFLEMLEEHARIEANANKKKKTVPKRTNGASGNRNEVEVKKMRLEAGFSVDTPFETDLLTPTWVEGPVDPKNTEQFAELDEDKMQAEITYNAIENNVEEEYQEQESDQQEEAKEESNNILVDPGKPFKNINRAHHCRSKFIDACVLCNIKHNFVVAHYVNQHRDSEVLIARLTQRDTDQLVKAVNCGYLAATRSTAYQYSATCVFCKREMCFALRYWWEHYTMHTGEYGYECSNCSLRRPRRQHAQKHANNECKLGEAHVKIIYHFDKTMNKIQAFICKLCNYIQLHRENVIKHLKTQHELKRDLGSNIIAVVLLQISRPYQESTQSQENSFDYDNSNSRQYATGENSYQSLESNPNEDYMQYSGEMPGDDLSYMICDMLATEDPGHSGVQPAETTTDSNPNQDENVTVDQDKNPANTKDIKVKAEATSSQ